MALGPLWYPTPEYTFLVMLPFNSLASRLPEPTNINTEPTSPTDSGYAMNVDYDLLNDTSDEAETTSEADDWINLQCTSWRLSRDPNNPGRYIRVPKPELLRSLPDPSTPANSPSAPSPRDVLRDPYLTMDIENALPSIKDEHQQECDVSDAEVQDHNQGRQASKRPTNPIMNRARSASPSSRGRSNYTRLRLDCTGAGISRRRLRPQALERRTLAPRDRTWASVKDGTWWKDSSYSVDMLLKWSQEAGNGSRDSDSF